MTQMNQLEFEIIELIIEKEKHHKIIDNFNSRIDEYRSKLKDLKRKETLERYKPHLKGYVDEYVDSNNIPCPSKNVPNDLSIRLLCERAYFRDFNSILQLFKSLKEKGRLIYVYNITELISYDTTELIPYNGNDYMVSYMSFKVECEK